MFKFLSDIPAISVDTTSYCFELGQPVILTCSVTSLPVALTVIWKKNNVDVTIDGDKYSGSSEHSPSLKINNATYDDEGTYVCSATNAVGTSTGEAITVYGTATSEYLS